MIMINFKVKIVIGIGVILGAASNSKSNVLAILKFLKTLRRTNKHTASKQQDDTCVYKTHVFVFVVI